MTLDLHAALRAAKNALATDKTWIFLLEVSLDGGSTILRLARSTEEVTFNAQTYSPFPFQIGEIRTDSEGNLATVDLAAMDMAGLIRQNMRLFNFDGAPVTLRLVESGDLATAARQAAQEFEILGWRGDFGQVVFHLGHPDYMLRIFPGRSYLRTRCSFTYKGEGCEHAGPEPSCSRHLEGANGCREKGNQARYGGAPAIPYGRSS